MQVTPSVSTAAYFNFCSPFTVEYSYENPVNGENVTRQVSLSTSEKWQVVGWFALGLLLLGVGAPFLALYFARELRERKIDKIRALDMDSPLIEINSYSDFCLSEVIALRKGFLNLQLSPKPSKEHPFVCQQAKVYVQVISGLGTKSFTRDTLITPDNARSIDFQNDEIKSKTAHLLNDLGLCISTHLKNGLIEDHSGSVTIKVMTIMKNLDNSWIYWHNRQTYNLKETENEDAVLNEGTKEEYTYFNDIRDIIAKMTPHFLGYKSEIVNAEGNFIGATPFINPVNPEPERSPLPLLR